MKRLSIGAALLIVVVLLVVAGTLAASLLGTAAPESEVSLQRPPAGHVRADYLPDGTPVWVIGHEDGRVDVLLGFDRHVPFNLGKLLWWCPSARALTNPHHGSRWDEFGVKLGGPAPAGLASWDVSTRGTRVFLGATRGAPSLETPPHGPPEVDRAWCTDEEDDVVFHAFEGWESWDSPTAALAAEPDGWVLIQGELVVLGSDVWLCAPAGCDDAARAANVEVPPPDMEPQFGPLGEGPFIAHVRDGVLIGVTRTAIPQRPDARP